MAVYFDPNIPMEILTHENHTCDGRKQGEFPEGMDYSI
jgi:hypothetical protein